MQSSSRGFCRASRWISERTQIPGSLAGSLPDGRFARTPMRCASTQHRHRLTHTRLSRQVPVNVAVSEGLHRRRTLTTKDKPHVRRRTPLANLFGKSRLWHVRCTVDPQNESRSTFDVRQEQRPRRLSRGIVEVQPITSDGRLPAEGPFVFGEASSRPPLPHDRTDCLGGAS